MAADLNDTEVIDHLDALHKKHQAYLVRIAELEAQIDELEDLLAKGKDERQSLLFELTALRAGKNISVVIDGKIYALHSAPASNGYMAPEEAALAVNVAKSSLADSFVL